MKLFEAKKSNDRKRPVSGVLKLMGTPMFKQRVEKAGKGKGSYSRKDNKVDIKESEDLMNDDLDDVLEQFIDTL